MQASVIVHMNAPADRIWDLIADVRNTGRFSPETFEAEWLDGATGPARGARFRGHVRRNEIGPVYWTTCPARWARFRGHVRRNEIGPVYWTTCRVTHCEPGRDFGFEVLIGDRPVNNWRYQLAPAGDGTDVTESFRMNDSLLTRLFGILGGQLRTRRNKRDMAKTLNRIKAVVEAED